MSESGEVAGNMAIEVVDTTTSGIDGDLLGMARASLAARKAKKAAALEAARLAEAEKLAKEERVFAAQLAEDERVFATQLAAYELAAALPENQDETVADYLKRVEAAAAPSPTEFNEFAVAYLIKNWEVLLNNLHDPRQTKMKREALLNRLTAYVFEEVSKQMMMGRADFQKFLLRKSQSLLFGVAGDLAEKREGGDRYLRVVRGDAIGLNLNCDVILAEVFAEAAFTDVTEPLTLETAILKIGDYMRNTFRDFKGNGWLEDKLMRWRQSVVGGYLAGKSEDITDEIEINKENVERFLCWALFVFSGIRRKIVDIKLKKPIKTVRKKTSPEKAAPVAVEKKDDDPDVIFPNMNDFPRLRDSLWVLMIREGIHKRYDQVMKDWNVDTKKEDKDSDAEQEFFLAMARITRKTGQYGAIRNVLNELSSFANIDRNFLAEWLGRKGTKKAFIKENGAINVPSEVADFYNAARYFHKLFRIGAVYARAGKGEMAERGELLMEIARMSADKLREIAVNVETKLTVEDFSDADLRETFDGLGAMINGAELTRYLKGASMVHVELQSVGEAQIEMVGGTSPALEKKLKALPPAQK